MGASSWSRFAIVLSIGAFLGGCGGKQPPEPPAAPARDSASTAPASEPKLAAGEAGENLRAALQRLQTHNDTLRSDLASREAEVTALEESKASLELELGIALEELLRSRANLKNVQSRAFAVSRIAEVRVELDSFRGKRDSTLSDRLDRAASFLERADRTLDEDNWGGAAFLAERAGELVRQAKTIAEIRKREPSGLVPIVPPRQLRTRALANLRRGPSTDTERVGAAEAGDELEAIGRLGEWFQIALAGGEKAWLHRSLVE